MKIQKDRVLKVLKDIAGYASTNICLHEETHRGGTIWEICDSCGMKWADDEGGKPKDAHDIPISINNAYDLIAEIEKGQTTA